MSEQKTPDKPSDTKVENSRVSKQDPQPKEYGGPPGKEPTRYGDWEKNGRCIDF